MIPSSYQSIAEWQRIVALNVNPILSQYIVDSAKLTYSGNAKKLFRINATEDGVELTDQLDTVTLLHSGTQVAATASTGIDLSSGKALSVAGTQVVVARKTGWAVDTGTAKRTANATYSGTAEASYTQATIQTLMNTVRDLSQTVKALKDDLHGTAGHGLIGT